MTTDAIIAANRFSLGAKPNELARAAINPKQWLKDQLQPPLLNPSLPNSQELMLKLASYREQKKALEKTKADNREKPFFRDSYIDFSATALRSAIESDHGLSWRLLDFFSNHFSVSAAGPVMTTLAPTLEREAIAPNLLGHFEDLLIAVAQHPAMLIYLNNEKSFGPQSKLGKRGKGINENLAREILELHTLGVKGGYQQVDIIALAMGISGWSVARPGKDKSAGFMFRDIGHQPGKQILLAKSYSQIGRAQGEAMLRDLAQQPTTAQHLSFKLAKHFIADQPDPDLVNDLTQVWKISNGHIKTVMTALIDHPLAWKSSNEKYKTPREFLLSSLRLLGHKQVNNKRLVGSLVQLGQAPFKAGSPAGFSDDKNDWLGASALQARIDWSLMLAGIHRKKTPMELIATGLGKNMNDANAKTIARAESSQQAIALLLLSPEFQRR